MRAIFRESALQERLGRDGYVEIDLLEHADVSELISLHDRHSDRLGAQAVTFTAMHPDANRRRVISDGIRAVLDPALERVLVDCRPVLGNFFCKQPSSADSEIHIHQDWSFVDETEHQSLTVWCPLQNITRESGTLSVVPGSHRLSDRPRGFVRRFPWPEVESVLKTQYSREVKVGPGQVVMFHQRLFHWSAPNHSAARRLAANCFVAPREATILYPHTDEEHLDRIEVFFGDDELLTSFTLGQRPEARSLGFVDSATPQLTRVDLERVLGPLWSIPVITARAQ